MKEGCVLMSAGVRGIIHTGHRPSVSSLLSSPFFRKHCVFLVFLSFVGIVGRWGRKEGHDAPLCLFVWEEKKGKQRPETFAKGTTSTYVLLCIRRR